MSLLNKTLFPEPKPKPVIKRVKKGVFKIVRKYPGGAEREQISGLTFAQAREICRAVHR